MSDFEEDFEGEPPTIDPYDVLDLERSATADEIKRAYRKAALKHHPDKAPDDPKKKKEAHGNFQEVAFAYAVLSDPARRKRYDETGSTSESIVDSDGFNWSDYYREQYKDAISADAIEKFAKQYKGSDEEKDDILQYFELYEGDMDKVYENVILSDPVDDDDRFRTIINDAIANREVPNFRTYSSQTERQRLAKINKARKVREAEAKEAESYAKEMGVHEKLFADKKGKKGKESSEDGLAALIQKRQQDRSSQKDDFLDRIAEKYGGASSKGKKGKKRTLPDEPPEEAFAATEARRKSAKASKDDPQTPPPKTGGRTRSSKA
ncbi:DnaJ subfamily C member-like protein [Hapsidospora chrysogenum ATCC 11550]|uniref:DnaJ subfamily C member-like protein n=1 Tax=Hapsidospora chrysogenum (strain ATCC 11550 / CBS 779.69 / DSM 880 / IAM 14645 / JCM 23072 / IMI 49137) TaxID=857340 RepID=A0A086T7W4_HAPC1|nr:DnaJ subfamily C member-like protein [Hapsidospora chrysogenum ATCC 11550]